jgi:solute carrier family 25 (adenine nucleotide translocator) protein 4/5/6/31
MDFLLGGLSSAVSKLGAGPVNRAKIIHQAQGELLRQGRLARPYGGLADALVRTVRAEGPLGLWRGVMYDVISYYPTQALNFALKDSFKKLFPFDRRQHGYGMWFFGACECCACVVRAACACMRPVRVRACVLCCLRLTRMMCAI